MKVGIIGGGASGIMSAIAISKKAKDLKLNDISITIHESNDVLGKKILASGNGQCNLTNKSISINNYQSSNKSILSKILNSFTYDDCINIWREFGLLTVDEKGWVYPNTKQSKTVVSILERELDRYNIKIKYNSLVEKVEYNNKTFTLKCTDKIMTEVSKSKPDFKNEDKNKSKKTITMTNTYEYNRLIISTGGQGSAVKGSNGSGYIFARKLGHKITQVLPGLVGLKTSGLNTSGIKSFRIISKLKFTHIYDENFPKEDFDYLENNDEIIITKLENSFQVEVKGEVQITYYGISGIPVFQLSTFISKILSKDKTIDITIDFLPDFSKEYIVEFLLMAYWNNPIISLKELLKGLFPEELIDIIFVNENNRYKNKLNDQLKKELDFIKDDINKPLVELYKLKVKDIVLDEYNIAIFISDIIGKFKNFNISVYDTNGFKNAQGCLGGISLEDINPKNMESKIIKGLYFGGEVTDVLGQCGGYNLHYAWATGNIIGDNFFEEMN
ncbi:MAG: NAD(P)/FAD-dependent oxidoreductase [Lachnospiraceae bacterium]|jgi:predicted flavoprotein YhiN|nr:NAD(P)/FAD-dependent oxidoreductase [Lachnospiraceae bacterium]